MIGLPESGWAARSDAKAAIGLLSAGHGDEALTIVNDTHRAGAGPIEASAGRRDRRQARPPLVPLVRERYFRYFLVVRAKDVQKAPIARLIAPLRSPEFARLARRLPGYDTTGAGMLLAGLPAVDTSV